MSALLIEQLRVVIMIPNFHIHLNVHKKKFYSNTPPFNKFYYNNKTVENITGEKIQTIS